MTSIYPSNYILASEHYRLGKLGKFPLKRQSGWIHILSLWPSKSYIHSGQLFPVTIFHHSSLIHAKHAHRIHSTRRSYLTVVTTGIHRSMPWCFHAVMFWFWNFEMPAESRCPILNFEFSNAHEHSLRPAFYCCNQSILLVKQMEMDRLEYWRCKGPSLRRRIWCIRWGWEPTHWATSPRFANFGYLITCFLGFVHIDHDMFE